MSGAVRSSWTKEKPSLMIGPFGAQLGAADLLVGGPEAGGRLVSRWGKIAVWGLSKEMASSSTDLQAKSWFSVAYLLRRWMIR